MITLAALLRADKRRQVQRQETDCAAMVSSGQEMMPDQLEAVEMIKKTDYNVF